jgi:hypothetical protein
MNEPPKFKWGSLIPIFLFMLLIFVGVFVANGDLKIFRRFTLIGGCGLIFSLVWLFVTNWENCTWEPEDDDSDDDE